jgi:hypothetical protein
MKIRLTVRITGMNDHLKDREIDEFVSGMATPEEALRIEAHLKECLSCGRRVEILAGIVSVRGNDAIPRDHVRNSVMREWQRISSKRTGEKHKSGPLFRLAFSLAALVLAALTAYLAISVFPGRKDEMRLSLVSVSGRVTVNNFSAREGDVLAEGNILETGASSEASFSSNGYSLKIGGASEIRLSGKDRKQGLLFTFIRGSLLSRSEGNLRYAFICGQYRVAPCGTEFTLHMENGLLEVAVFSGKVMVAGAGMTREVPSKTRWSSEYPGSLKPVSSSSRDPEYGTGTGRAVTPDKPEIMQSGIPEGDRDIRKSPDTDSNDRHEMREQRGSVRELRQELNEIKKDRKGQSRGRGGN